MTDTTGTDARLDRIKKLEAKLAEVEADADVWQQRALHINEVAGVQIARAEAAEKRVATLEAALVAVHQLALGDAATACDKERDEARANYCPTQAVGAVWSAKAIRALPTPTADELMARIKTGEKE